MKKNLSGLPNSCLCEAVGYIGGKPVPHSHLEDDGKSYDIRPDLPPRCICIQGKRTGYIYNQTIFCNTCDYVINYIEDFSQDELNKLMRGEV